MSTVSLPSVAWDWPTAVNTAMRAALGSPGQRVHIMQGCHAPFFVTRTAPETLLSRRLLTIRSKD